MILSRTPHRISFFGGGTDYPEYYREYGGKTLGVAIDKYSYLNVRKLPPFFDYKHRIVYSKQENVVNLDDIVHPSVRETLKYMQVNSGISIHHDGDIPARSGMGSSSSFTVGLINSINALNGKMSSKDELTQKSIHIEQNLIKENVGSQDQAFAAHGGLNIINFLQNGKISVTPIIMKKNRMITFQDNIMLFFSGISRTASDVVVEQINKTSINVPNLNKMKDLVDEAHDILISNRNLNEFGELLNTTWELKKSLSSKVTNKQIDDMYNRAIKAGAIGGKLLGAGGGGFMSFYVEKENQEAVKEALHDYLYIPFNFDFEGSKIVVYEPNYKDK
ncbi:kinase [Sulfurimonas sp.]|uniref:GHMP family kinase ATP-binding protein n=1 Tax=Sulfurimonas sp. TaxID=2022749 RepID=UPI00356B08BA